MPLNSQKIGDFGLASYMDKGPHKTMCGTPSHMPPEVVSHKPYGFEYDIWSLGCILYCLLIGTPPFHETTVDKVMHRILNEELKFPKGSGVSKEAKDLLKNILKKDPSKRFSLDEILQHPFMQDKRQNVILESTKYRYWN